MSLEEHIQKLAATEGFKVYFRGFEICNFIGFPLS
jgi:hypothetical protein